MRKVSIHQEDMKILIVHACDNRNFKNMKQILIELKKKQKKFITRIKIYQYCSVSNRWVK